MQIILEAIVNLLVIPLLMLFTRYFTFISKYVGNDTSSTYEHEIEAYLFGAMVDHEVDNKNPNVYNPADIVSGIAIKID